MIRRREGELERERSRRYGRLSSAPNTTLSSLLVPQPLRCLWTLDNCLETEHRGILSNPKPLVMPPTRSRIREQRLASARKLHEEAETLTRTEPARDTTSFKESKGMEWSLAWSGLGMLSPQCAGFQGGLHLQVQRNDASRGTEVPRTQSNTAANIATQLHEASPNGRPCKSNCSCAPGLNAGRISTPVWVSPSHHRPIAAHEGEGSGPSAGEKPVRRRNNN